MDVCVFVCMYVHICACMCMCLHVCVHMCAYMYMPGVCIEGIKDVWMDEWSMDKMIIFLKHDQLVSCEGMEKCK